MLDLNIKFIKTRLLFLGIIFLIPTIIFSEVLTTSDFITKIICDLNLQYRTVGECGAGEKEFEGIRKVSKGMITKEKLYEISPKFILGREGIFTEKVLGKELDIEDIGSKSLIFYSGGPNGSLEIFFNDLEKLGKNLKIDKKIQLEIERIKGKYKYLENKEKNRSALFISSMGETLGVVGEGGLLKDILIKTDLENIVKNESQNYFKISWEVVVNEKIDIIFILGKNYEESYKKYLQLQKNNFLKEKKAVINNEIYHLNYMDIAPNLDIINIIEKLNENTNRKIK